MLKTMIPGGMDFKTERERQLRRRKNFFLSMIVVLIFYPFIPAITYILLLWSWGNGKAQPETLSRRENFAMVAHSITGGFEAPVQLTMTIWLMLRGIIDNDFSFAKAFIDLGLPEDRFGNTVPLPAIPVISSLTSLISIMFACVRLNIPQPYQSYAIPNFSKRHSKRFSQVMAHLPFFLCSVLFRVMSYAFMWVYLSGSIIYPFIPLTCTFIGNLVIGYSHQTDKQMKKEMKSIRKRIKKHLKGKEDECKYRRIELAVWLSSFIGIFIPCCYSQQLEDKIINKIHCEEKCYKHVQQDKQRGTQSCHLKSKEILQKLDEIREDFQNRVLKKQEFWGTFVNLVSSAIIFALVNCTDTYKYADNKLTNFSFNIYSYVLAALGVMCLLFTFLNFDILKLLSLGHVETKDISNVTADVPITRKKEKTRFCGQFLVSCFFSFLVVTPILLGGYYNQFYSKPEGFAILVPDPAALKNEMNITMVKVNPINNKSPETTGKFISCEKYFTNENQNTDKDKTFIVYADLSIPECSKHLVDQKDFEKTVERRQNKDAILIAENFKHRSSSSFPETTFDDISQTFTDKSISHLKTFDKIPILSFNQMDKKYFESNGVERMEGQEVRIVMKDISDLLKPATSELLSVECNDRECIHLEDPDNGNSAGSTVFLGCDSQPKRSVTVTIECRDKGKLCTEFERYERLQSKEKETSCRGEIITMKFNGTRVPLNCKGKTTKNWNTRERNLICDDENQILDHPNKIKCCRDTNRATIYAKEGCKKPSHLTWGSWSEWNTGLSSRDRSRFSYVDNTCSYLETQFIKLKTEEYAKQRCGDDEVYKDNDKCDGY